MTYKCTNSTATTLAKGVQVLHLKRDRCHSVHSEELNHTILTWKASCSNSKIRMAIRYQLPWQAGNSG